MLRTNVIGTRRVVMALGSAIHRRPDISRSPNLEGRGSWTHAKGHLCSVSSNHLKEEKRASTCRSDVHVQANAVPTLNGEVIYHGSLSYSRVTEEFRLALSRRTESMREAIPDDSMIRLDIVCGHMSSSCSALSFPGSNKEAS